MKTLIPSPAFGPRAALALALAMSLLVLLLTPLCATEACPMGPQAKRAGCHPMDGGCCQTQGTQSASAPVQVLPPTLAASAPVGSAAGEGTWPVEAAALPEALALPSILQGIGLHAFLEVFLI